jgi:hypothetical protein
MIQLVYISHATEEFKNDVNTQLESILSSSVSFNSSSNITGILIYNSGVFLQLLEGEEEDLTKLYQRIGNDMRHKDLSLLVKQEATERLFPNWAMTSCNLELDKFSDFRNSKEWSTILQTSLDNKQIDDLALLDFIEKFRLHL